MIYLLNTTPNITDWITAIGALGTLIAAIFIGKKQNDINQKALNIQNFVEIFLMPQQVVLQSASDVNQKNISWNILVKNVSSYPVYLNSYVLNGLKKDIGNTAIPNNSDSWYGIIISQDVQNKGELSLTLYFEDYLGKKYQSDGFGKWEGVSWNIHQKKRLEIDN